MNPKTVQILRHLFWHIYFSHGPSIRKEIATRRKRWSAPYAARSPRTPFLATHFAREPEQLPFQKGESVNVSCIPRIILQTSLLNIHELHKFVERPYCSEVKVPLKKDSFVWQSSTSRVHALYIYCTTFSSRAVFKRTSGLFSRLCPVSRRVSRSSRIGL